ncbi:hypothetical protein KP509_05G035100 [Ceratopteris richardii]|uniref:F-box domain-containing protein n=1 Tax=Ceratopteris richardii TaxID=49495 RepID=A0A8T2UXG7_CERRI|nr:hypothetical protein KP509_05G035100 [Ceratopteris richardii]
MDAFLQKKLEQCLERVALLLASRAAQASGSPLSAAAALAQFFQVCRSWRAVSYSQSLWRRLCLSIWNRDAQLRESSWHQTFITLHRTAVNFSTGSAERYLLDSDSLANHNDATASCRRLAISSDHLAGGFSDGSLCVFSLDSKDCVCSFQTFHESVIGTHSRTIIGIILPDDEETVTFACMDGSVFKADIAPGAPCRRVLMGNYVEDGILADFSGNASKWAGLYAGVRGRALRVWDAYSEELVYVGGCMTDADAYAGWTMLVDNADNIGRVKVTRDRLLVVATRSKLCVMDMEALTILLDISLSRSLQVIPASLALQDKYMLLVSGSGVVRILGTESAQEVASFSLGMHIRGSTVFGAMNSWHLMVNSRDILHVWDFPSIRRPYRLATGLTDVTDLVCNDNNIAIACGSGEEQGIHIWDFTPRP